MSTFLNAQCARTSRRCCTSDIFGRRGSDSRVLTDAAKREWCHGLAHLVALLPFLFEKGELRIKSVVVKRWLFHLAICKFVINYYYYSNFTVSVIWLNQKWKRAEDREVGRSVATQMRKLGEAGVMVRGARLACARRATSQATSGMPRLQVKIQLNS